MIVTADGLGPTVDSFSGRDVLTSLLTPLIRLEIQSFWDYSGLTDLRSLLGAFRRAWVYETIALEALGLPVKLPTSLSATRDAFQVFIHRDALSRVIPLTAAASLLLVMGIQPTIADTVTFSDGLDDPPVITTTAEVPQVAEPPSTIVPERVAMAMADDASLIATSNECKMVYYPVSGKVARCGEPEEKAAIQPVVPNRPEPIQISTASPSDNDNAPEVVEFHPPAVPEPAPKISLVDPDSNGDVPLPSDVVDNVPDAAPAMTSPVSQQTAIQPVDYNRALIASSATPNLSPNATQPTAMMAVSPISTPTPEVNNGPAPLPEHTAVADAGLNAPLPAMPANTGGFFARIMHHFVSMFSWLHRAS